MGTLLWCLHSTVSVLMMLGRPGTQDIQIGCETALRSCARRQTINKHGFPEKVMWICLQLGGAFLKKNLNTCIIASKNRDMREVWECCLFLEQVPKCLLSPQHLEPPTYEYVLCEKFHVNFHIIFSI